jgi:hypothetical protein
MNFSFLEAAANSGKLDMVALKAYDANLFRKAHDYIPADGVLTSTFGIPTDIAEQLNDWLASRAANWMDDHKQEIRNMNATAKQRLLDERAATARLAEWESAGLLNNQHNHDAITDFIATSHHLQALKGRLTAQAVDICIDFLGPKGSNTLQWVAKKVAPVVASAPMLPKVRVLSNGEPELPLNATEQQMRKASITQLKDLSRRQTEG